LIPFIKRTIFYLVVVVQFMVTGRGATAQTITQSPYSRFGLGELQKDELTQNLALGGAAQAIQAPSYINIANPAALSHLKVTAFQASAKGVYSLQETNTVKQNARTASFSSLALAFPISKKWWTSAIGIKPYSSIGYNIYDYQSDSLSGGISYSFKGDGGLNKVFWANGFTPFKNFNIGVSANYLFGVINKERKLAFPESSTYFNTIANESLNLNGLDYKVGAQYKIDLKKDYALVLGASASSSSTLSGTQTIFIRTYKVENGVDKLKDTVWYQSGKKGQVILPAGFAAGIALSKSDKWIWSAEYKAEDWSTYRSFGQTDTLSASSTVAFGTQYIPAPGSNSRVKETAYRAGFRHTNSFLNLQNTRLTETAVTLGAGIPTRRSYAMIGDKKRIYSTLNIALEFGQRGALTNNLIRERFIMVNVGITINDNWFDKSKID
jgi:hypothetical protein